MGTENGVARDDIDWKSEAVLWAIHENGGAANTSEIRSITGIDQNAIVLYRLNNKLAPLGLVDLMQPEADAGRPRAKVATLTERGKELADRLAEVHEEPAIELVLGERVDRLEARANSDYGMWSGDKQREYEQVVDAVRVIRDYIDQRDDEFREFADDYSGPE
jgi:DNA-binding MarR family transcriptional regulator